MASTSYLPRGCTVYQNYPGNLVFNGATSTPPVCGYNNRYCLCAAFGPAPPCDVQDGTAPHTSTTGTGCFCGDTAMCTGAKSTGLYCNSHLSRCAPYAIPTCPIGNGTEANPFDCACGTADCSGGGENSTGLFCYAPQICAHPLQMPGSCTHRFSGRARAWHKGTIGLRLGKSARRRQRRYICRTFQLVGPQLYIYLEDAPFVRILMT